MTAAVAAQATEADSLAWRGWSDDVFDLAKRENKFVLLDLEAVWCHWCHVMADTTYKDTKVVELMEMKYIPVRVDQDARPDLSVRYEEWGWPATVVFAPDGTEIVKRRGYIPPKAMASLLQAIIDDPSPGPSVLSEANVEPSALAFLKDEQRESLAQKHEELYDLKNAGWGSIYKLIDPYHWEYAFVRAQAGDKVQELKARKTLDQALYLLDSEWGGFYQYSDKTDWKSPHFEKIMSIQSSYIRIYALAYAYWRDPRYLEAAQKTARYVREFWESPEGSFYTSQDADVDANMNGKFFYSMSDAERRKVGKIPRIDTHRYARENGWMISAFTALYNVTGEELYLSTAIRAAQWVLANRNLEPGGFRHDEVDPGGPYLSDTLYMGQAFLELYVSTANRDWLEKSKVCARFVENYFKDSKGGGYITSPAPLRAGGVLKKPVKQVEENIQVVRWTNSLFHYTSFVEHRTMAEHAMRYLAAPAIVEKRPFLVGLLLADAEISSDPLHVTVVGAKKDPAAASLYRLALETPFVYRRLEWWDVSEGPLPNPDVQYPELAKPAAFLCANKACSLPFFTQERLSDALKKESRRGML